MREAIKSAYVCTTAKQFLDFHIKWQWTIHGRMLRSPVEYFPTCVKSDSVPVVKYVPNLYHLGCAHGIFDFRPVCSYKHRFRAKNLAIRLRFFFLLHISLAFALPMVI